MKVVTVLYGQTLIDIAIQELGDAARVFEIAELNDISLTDDLEAGSTLLVPDWEKSKRSIVQLFTDPANAPASADTDSLSNKNEGIDYWVLENDFVVQ